MSSMIRFSIRFRCYACNSKKEPPKFRRDRGPFLSQLDYQSRLQFETPALKVPLTSIICTIGPSSNCPEVLLELIRAGMRVVRINFSHGNHDCHCQYIQAARKAISMYVEQTGLPRTLAIALDTKGPEIRTGKISGDCDIQLQEGDQVILSTKKELRENCTKEKVYVDNQQLPGIIKPGNQIFLDEGLISLVVHESKGEEVICEVQSGGELGSHKDVNLPGTTIDLPSITEQDKLDLKFGAEQKVDMIFASFIRDAKAANEVRQALGSSGDHIKIISKIENQKGLANIDEIIRESDGIMIARGNMGIDMPIEDVPLAQKTIVAKCNKVGKPVICAAHMMDSMRNKPRPSRAEVSDVANAILDGFDAVMLSDETANGKYPVDCVKSMARICSKVESVLWYERLQFSLKNEIRSCPDYISSVTSAIAETATVIRAQAIVVACPCSIIAQMISNMRPPCPIVMLSGCQSESAQSLISRGVHPILVEEMVNGSLNFRCIMQSGLKLMSKLDILEPGEQGTVVLVNAMSAENITFRLDSYRQQTKAERDEEERCRKLAFEQRCKEKAQKESCQEPKEPEECVKKCEPTVKCSKPEEKPKVCPKKECLKKHNKESNCLKVIEESRAREEAKKKRRDASKNAKSFPTNCMKSMENKCPKKEEEASKCSRLENQKQTKAENKCEKQSEIPEDSCEKCEMEEKTIACPKKECPTQDTESLICLKLKKERQAQQEAERKRREKSRKREETLRNRQAKERKLAEKCMKPKKKKCPKKDEEDEVSKCLNLNVQAQKKQKAEKDQKCESESAKNSCAEKEKPSVGPKRECPKDILALKCLQLKCEREAKLKAEKKRIEESKKCQKNKNTKKCILTEVRVKSGENPIVYPKWECPKKDNKAELAARKKQREECARPCEVKRKECKTLKLENCKLRKPEKTLKLVNCKQLCKNTKKMSYKVEALPDSYADLGEGPHWDVDRQSLYYVDLESAGINRYDYKQNKVYKAKIEGETFASFILPIENKPQEFAVGCARRVAIVQWDGVSAVAKVVCTLFEVQPDWKDNRINDAKTDPNGRFYGGTMITTGDIFTQWVGELYSWQAGGQPKVIRTKVGISNGLAWDVKAKKFYFIDTNNHEVVAYDYNQSTGAVCNPKVIFDLRKIRPEGPLFPDGMTVDTDGNIYVATFNGGTIFKVNPNTGKILLEIKIPTTQITSVAFGGPNLDILYVTTANKFDQPKPAGTTYQVTGLNAKGYAGVNLKI